MILAGGVQDNGEGQMKTYKFFEGELFGMEKTIQYLVEDYLNLCYTIELRSLRETNFVVYLS